MITTRALQLVPVVLLTTVLGISAAPQLSPAASAGSASVVQSATVPPDFVIGVEDRLAIVFWREQDKALTSEVVVRPDGKVSVPMLNDIRAAGLTPEELARSVQEAASKYIRDAAATVVVREIHSRKVFVIGEVSAPGAVAIGAELNVLQAIAQAGGFLEHAKKSDVVIVRKEGGQERRFKFNYKDVVKGKKVEQNIPLLPGDTILVR